MHKYLNTHKLNNLILGCLFSMVFCSTFSIALTQISYFTALILWLYLIVTKEEKFQSTPLDMWFLLYLIVEVVTTIFAYDRLDAFLHIQKRLLLLPIVYLLFRYLDTRARIQKALTTLFISGSLVGLVSSVYILLQFSDYVHYVKRFNAYNHYMTIGGLSMIMLLLMIPFALHRKTEMYKRILLLIGIGSIFFSLVVTFTRSSWLGLICGLLCLAILRFRVLLYFILIFAVGLVIFGSPELHSRFLSIFDPTDPSNDLRLRMWSVGLKIFSDHPIIGVGDITLNPLNDLYSQHTMDFGHMHNNLVQWLVTLGTVGFLIVILWFVNIWKLLWKTYRSVKDDWLFGNLAIGGVAVFIGFFINGLFEWNFGDAEVYTLFWIVIGFILSAKRSYENTELSLKN